MSEHSSETWPPPRDFWRGVPCGHPQDPVAWVAPVTDPVCHCGAVLDLSKAMFDLDPPDHVESVVPCERCGCGVGIPAHRGVLYPVSVEERSS